MTLLLEVTSSTVLFDLLLVPLDREETKPTGFNRNNCHPISMAANGFVANIKGKMFKKEDGSSSPSVPQQDPQKPKRKLGDDDDELVFEVD